MAGSDATTQESHDDAAAAAIYANRARRRVVLAILDNLVWLILGLLLVAFSIGISGFLSVENLINVGYHSVFLGVVAIALSFVLIIGHIDLSVGSIAGLAALTSAWLAGTSVFASGMHVDPFVALLFVLLLGGGIGFFNGFLVTKLGISSFLVTFATLLVVQGTALVLTEGKGVSGLPDSGRLIDTVRPLGIPLMVYLVVFLYVLFEFILRRTQFGRHLYVIGGNLHAAYNFGVRVNPSIVRVFVFSGAMAALAGWLLAARLNGATPAVATNLLFDGIAAAVIGGVSLTGGVGSLRGVLGGVLLLGTVTTALDIQAVDPYLVQVLRGLLVLGAIVLDSVKRRYR